MLLSVQEREETNQDGHLIQLLLYSKLTTKSLGKHNCSPISDDYLSRSRRLREQEG